MGQDVRSGLYLSIAKPDSNIFFHNAAIRRTRSISFLPPLIDRKVTESEKPSPIAVFQPGFQIGFERLKRDLESLRIIRKAIELLDQIL